ncbi:MAG: type III-B CRISPR module RAMP protein Cmr6 [Syntrophaceae bacterium]
MADEILSPRRELVAILLGREIIPPGANPGLIFDRYLPIWRGVKRTDNPFTPLSGFVRRFNELERELQPVLARIHDRQKRFIGHAGGNGMAGVAKECKVSWRLVTGMGNDHPLENGFTMDYLTGVPFIRATALKGLCRRAADLLGEEDGWNPEIKKDLFGSFDTAAYSSLDRKERGDIVFLDAYPSHWPKLEVDIMNTHHPSYYRKYESDELRETENPVPVFFLTVAAETGFIFRFFSRMGSTANVERMEKVLIEGLTTLGVGAKTAVGYGRFDTPASEGTAWLEKALKELCAEHRESKEKNILRGKPLAVRWQAIADPVLKQEVLDAIKQRWEEFDLFNSGGRALKQVKQIYWGG